MIPLFSEYFIWTWPDKGRHKAYRVQYEVNEPFVRLWATKCPAGSSTTHRPQHFLKLPQADTAHFLWSRKYTDSITLFFSSVRKDTSKQHKWLIFRMEFFYTGEIAGLVEISISLLGLHIRIRAKTKLFVKLFNNLLIFILNADMSYKLRSQKS